MRHFLALAGIAIAMPAAMPVHSEPIKVAVQGQIVPAACTAQLANLGVFQNDAVTPKTLSMAGPTLLPALDQQLRITCGAKTRVALAILDVNAGAVAFQETISFFDEAGKSWSPKRQYGLRNHNGKGVGSWALRLVPGTYSADQQLLDSIYSDDQGQTWQPSVGNFFPNDGDLESWALPGTGTPVAAYEFVGTVRTQVALDKTTRLNIADEIHFRGDAILTLVYL